MKNLKEDLREVNQLAEERNMQVKDMSKTIQNFYSIKI